MEDEIKIKYNLIYRLYMGSKLLSIRLLYIQINLVDTKLFRDYPYFNLQKVQYYF